jgi:hypothetical protein
MNHFMLLVVCILSVEIFIRLKFTQALISIIDISYKVFHLILKVSVSDHWKEKVIPAYSLKMIKFSLQIFAIVLCISSVVAITESLFFGFLSLLLSFMGIIEAIIFAMAYVYLRKVVAK